MIFAKISRGVFPIAASTSTLPSPEAEKYLQYLTMRFHLPPLFHQKNYLSFLLSQYSFQSF